MSCSNELFLKVSHIEESTGLLGPYDRFVIWVHGCCFDCDGCLARNTRFGAYEDIEINVLAKKIANSSCEGITVSGGEPFLQPVSLLTLFREIKKQRDIGVIVYSGFTLDEIRQDRDKLSVLSEIDVLIDGRYIKELDDGRAYVGSSNQRIHYLTSRYAVPGKTYYTSAVRRAEIKLTPTKAVLIGIPSSNVLKLWKEIKHKGGGTHDDF